MSDEDATTARINDAWNAGKIIIVAMLGDRLAAVSVTCRPQTTPRSWPICCC